MEDGIYSIDNFNMDTEYILKTTVNDSEDDTAIIVTRTVSSPSPIMGIIQFMKTGCFAIVIIAFSEPYIRMFYNDYLC
tara:strand:+ start:3221 stop:3454 length:234 start_codon:yes stop_codon:yes gene_type:complete